MAEDWNIEELEELAASYGIGALDPAEAQAFEQRLAADPGLPRAEVAAFQETAAKLAYSVPAAAPDPGLRARLLAHIRSIPSEPIPGFHILKSSTEGWRKSKYSGVTFKTLLLDRTTGMATSLLRLEPGAFYPRHRHTEVEQCLVLEGDCYFGDLSLHAGDYEWATADTVHPPIGSRGGCTLLIIASQHDELME